jgi:hypothetical protein
MALRPSAPLLVNRLVIYKGSASVGATFAFPE